MARAAKQVHNYNYFVSQKRRLKSVFPIAISVTSGEIKQEDNYNVHLTCQIRPFEMIITAVLG